MTQLTIINSALSILGEEQLTPAELLASTLPRAAQANLQWDFALEELLRSFPWQWARTREELEEASPVPTFEWAHRFLLPDDFVTLLSLNETSMAQPSELFALEGGYLLTDESTASVEYVRKPSDSELDDFLALADPLSVAALVTLLAAKMATKLARDGMATMQMLERKYLTSDLPRARVLNGNERKEYVRNPAWDSRWISYRRASTNG